MVEKKTVDARGLFCPGPIQVLQGVLKRVNPGEYLELLADDPDSKKDVKEWCESKGHQLESITEDENGISFMILKKT
jgi:tRNA 2-thiouridine synthesizing protein A